MDIKADFLNALISAPKLFPGFQAEKFLGQIYDMDDEPDSPFFSALSGGSITALSPFSFDIRSLDCYILLYTKSGCGKLLIENQVHTLTESSLLFFDCHQRFRFDIATSPWKYDILFLTGKNLPDYYNMIPEKISITPIPPYSETALHFEKLLFFAGGKSLSSKLTVSTLINTVITGCILHHLSEGESSPHIASYLTQMKDLFDTDFQENYSLDELQERFHISKYKLCREFGAAFGMPPLQYLNRKRIEFAKHLLLTTSLKVHEAGSQAGIDNTNHFISLFKKFTGLTPLEFKQKGRE